MNLISTYSSFIKDELDGLAIPEIPINLYDPLRYFLKLEGKKIRPVLTLLSAELFGGTIEKAKHAALAIELFHNFTLIHDDIMDKAPLRRGKSTVHNKWNSNIAILSGDVLLVKAYEQLALSSPKVLPELMKLFNKTAIEVCEGQQMDMDYEKHESLSKEEYIQMIKLKTSVLLGCALEMGAIICEESNHNRSRIYEFGVNLGIAFQIQDDLLDLYGDTEKVGKQKGGDIIANKNTLLSIIAEKNANDEQLIELKKIRLENDPIVKTQQTQIIFDQIGIRHRCTEVMQNYYNKALENFSAIETSNSGSEILELGKLLMNRPF